MLNLRLQEQQLAWEATGEEDPTSLRALLSTHLTAAPFLMLWHASNPARSCESAGLMDSATRGSGWDANGTAGYAVGCTMNPGVMNSCRCSRRTAVPMVWRNRMVRVPDAAKNEGKENYTSVRVMKLAFDGGRVVMEGRNGR